MVPDLYTAWHAGKSVWKNYSSLNKDSIGIEIVNPGHDINYKKFSKIQLAALVRLSKYKTARKKDPGEKFPWKLLSKKKIGYWHNLNQNELIKNRNLKTSSKEKNLFLTNLFKIGYQKKFLYNSNFNHISFDQIISKAFQRRFRPEVVNGKIDQECLLISQNLVKK